jgi:hypothetical protein
MSWPLGFRQHPQWSTDVGTSPATIFDPVAAAAGIGRLPATLCPSPPCGSALRIRATAKCYGRLPEGSPGRRFALGRGRWSGPETTTTTKASDGSRAGELDEVA